jgi:hypothetical protein
MASKDRFERLSRLSFGTFGALKRFFYDFSLRQQSQYSVFNDKLQARNRN